MSGPSNATTLLVAWVVAPLWALGACGGTTGKEDLPDVGSPYSVDQDATVDAEASDASDGGFDQGTPDSGLDATLGALDGDGDSTFDVTIQYADAARLPDVVAVAESGGGMDSAAETGPVGPTWPACGCDYVPTDITLCPVTDDAASCASSQFVWTRSARCDQCARYNCEISNEIGNTTPPLPPCCDIPRTGNIATSGPKTGTSRYDLCVDYFSCIVRSCSGGQCTQSSAVSVLCGDAGTTDCEMGKTNGPCANEAFAAFEQNPTDPSAITFMINHFTDVTLAGKVGAAGGEVGGLYACMVQPVTNAGCYELCFSADAGDDAAPGYSPDGGPSPSCLP